MLVRFSSSGRGLAEVTDGDVLMDLSRMVTRPSLRQLGELSPDVGYQQAQMPRVASFFYLYPEQIIRMVGQEYRRYHCQSKHLLVSVTM